MEIFTPKVKDISLFKQIAMNVQISLEILREAISNSVDACADQITIILSRDYANQFMIEIIDNGRGMDSSGLQRFFNLGDSGKEMSIGDKGLGTKTYFRSRRIEVWTQTKNGVAYKAVMEDPWQKLLHNVIPTYSIEETTEYSGGCGTSVTIIGYVMERPEKCFNIYTVKDYIQWFTAGGSFKQYFLEIEKIRKLVNNLNIIPTISISDKIMNKSEEFIGTHPFQPEQENPKEDMKERIYRKTTNINKIIGPYHFETNFSDGYASFQVFGAICGENIRKADVCLKQGESLKSRYGLYLSRDFIPFKRRNDILNDLNYEHYLIFVNSQNFQLTSDRNNLSNGDDPKIKWIIAEVMKLIKEEIRSLANKIYFKVRKKEEKAFQYSHKISIQYGRLNYYNRTEDLKSDKLPIIKIPYSESQVLIIFVALITNKQTKHLIKHIDKIGLYDSRYNVDMICVDYFKKQVFVEIEYKLSRFFIHDHPMEVVNYIVCWECDIKLNERKKTMGGNVLTLIQKNEEKCLKCGSNEVIKIIELKPIIELLGSGIDKCGDI